jgi:dethiobiotin synthetase
MTKTLFITGTDTGVGKTLATTLLALHFQAQGLDVGVMKPLASGCTEQDGVLVNEDAEFLQQMTGVADGLDLINPVRYIEPLAPLVAARRAGESTDTVLEQVFAALEELKQRHEIVLVEGVGGLLVPLAESRGEAGSGFATCVDLARVVGGPSVVVARRNLGTINHTALTVELMRREGLPVEALLFCDAAPLPADDVAANTSPAIIAEMTGLPVWGQVPFLQKITAASLKLAAAEFIRPVL